MSDLVLFVPGFFGFGEFGSAQKPFIEYFARVEDALLAARPGLRFAVHEPPPAGSLQERARSLELKLSSLAAEPRIHLVGHSSGGVDARLVMNAKYNAQPPRNVVSLVTISAPLRGTPLARRVGRGLWLAAPALWFASILASRGRLRIAGMAATLFNLLKKATLQEPTPTDELIAQLADVDRETATQIRRFLRDVASDHRLVDDLTPEKMSVLDASIAGGDSVPLRSFVSVSPPAGLSPLKFVTAPLQRLFYDASYALTATAPRDGGAVPRGPWLGHGRTALGERANDGIVPAWSQTLDGAAAGIVLGDHLDVIGHYESQGATFLRSGSDFDDARFRALWTAVADALQA